MYPNCLCGKPSKMETTKRVLENGKPHVFKVYYCNECYAKTKPDYKYYGGQGDKK